MAFQGETSQAIEDGTLGSLAERWIGDQDFEGRDSVALERKPLEDRIDEIDLGLFAQIAPAGNRDIALHTVTFQ